MYGDDSEVFNYANKDSGIDLAKVLVMVAINSTKYAGTCYMYRDGSAIAYLHIGESDSDQFETLVHHEAGGHGFAKLLDEYSYTGVLPDD